MSYETILVDKRGAVGTITLNRPEALNALNRRMIEEIARALDDLERDDAIRVVVITGAGRAFCAGVDLKFASSELGTLGAQLEFFRLSNEGLLGRLESLAKPVVAAVNGLALAGGFELMLAADLAVAAEEAMLGDQHINVGLVGAGGSTPRLALLVGLRKAKELILTGRLVSGKEAERLGLVNRSVPAGDLWKAVDEMVAQLTDKSPVAMRLSKSLINRAAMVDFESRLELAVATALVNNASEDAREGMQAFVERRKPVFRGR